MLSQTNSAGSLALAQIQGGVCRLLYRLYCLQVLLQGVEMVGSPYWTLHVINSSRVQLRDLTIRGQMDMPNNDGESNNRPCMP